MSDAKKKALISKIATSEKKIVDLKRKMDTEIAIINKSQIELRKLM